MLVDITDKREDKGHSPKHGHQAAQHDPEPRAERPAAAFVALDIFECEDAKCNCKHSRHHTDERKTREQPTVPCGNGPEAFAEWDNPIQGFRAGVIGNFAPAATTKVLIVVIVLATAPGRAWPIRNGGVGGGVANQFLPTGRTRECRRSDLFAARGATRFWTNFRHAVGPFNRSFRGRSGGGKLYESS
jgi:hypothetical protein